MNKLIFFISVIAIACAIEDARAEALSVPPRLLQGSKSIDLRYKIYDTPGCKVIVSGIEAGHQYQLSLSDVLQEALPNEPSDLVSTLLIESAEGADSSGALICAYVISLRVFHQLNATLRYRKEPTLLPVLVFSKSIFGVGRPESLDATALRYSGKLIQLLIDEHNAANKGTGTLKQ